MYFLTRHDFNEESLEYFDEECNTFIIFNNVKCFIILYFLYLFLNFIFYLFLFINFFFDF